MYGKNEIKTGTFAKMVNVNIKTLIYYDITGQFKAFRTSTNRRYYTHNQVGLWKKFKKGNLRKGLS